MFQNQDFGEQAAGIAERFPFLILTDKRIFADAA